MTWEQDLMWWRKPSLLPLQKIILTQSTKHRNHKHLKYIYKSTINKSEKGKSLVKSRSTQGNEIEDTVKSVIKSRSISSASSSDKSTKIEKPKEIDISKDNSSLFGMSRYGEILTSVTPDKQRIPRKNKRKKTPYTYIKGKEVIQEPDNPSKRAKDDSIPDVEKLVKKNLHRLKIRKTTLVILMRRLVVPMILQVTLIVVWETWSKNMKMKRINNSVKIPLR